MAIIKKTKTQSKDDSFLQPLNDGITEKKVSQIFQKYHAVWCRYTVKNLMEKCPAKNALTGLERGFLESYTVYQLEYGKYIVKYAAHFWPKGDCCYDIGLEIKSIFPYTDATISKLTEVFRSAYKIYHDTTPLQKNSHTNVTIQSKILDQYFSNHDHMDISQYLLIASDHKNTGEGDLL